jgi:ABC-2 type transport system ATP-binding protein
MTAIIETHSLTKKYRRITALDDLDLVVEEGAVYGLVGPNGAGKTTTMRILAALLSATSGEAWVGGHSVSADPRAVRRIIGYMPDFFGVYGDLKVWELLDFFAACYEIPTERRNQLVIDLLELVELSHRSDDYVEGLSRGMKQRLCLARALTHDPRVLILDEPASGLDPRARVEMRDLLRELHSMGKTVIVSSHILSEIEDVCTHIGIIEAGRLVASGSLEEIRQRAKAHRLIHIGLHKSDEQVVDRAQAWLVGRSDVLEVQAAQANGEADLIVSFAGDAQGLTELLSAMVGEGLPILLFREEPSDLEDAFMRLTQGIVS